MDKNKATGCDDVHCCSHGHCSVHESEKVCISLVPIFNHLQTDQLTEIMSCVRRASYKRNDIIYSAGDRSSSLYIVSNGRIKIYRISESGKEQLLRILNPGDFTGELALFSELYHEAYAEAMIDTQVCIITHNDLQNLLIKYPTISLKILSEFARRLDISERQTTNLATERVEKRLALFLVECTEHDKKKDVITLPMSKKDLASYLGTTPETISRKLSELENDGLIRQLPQRKIRILDLESLQTYG